MKIELRRRIGTSGWNKGQVIRGDREIWVQPEGGELEKWGHVVMEGHGCHGPSYAFHDANEYEISERDEDGSISRYAGTVTVRPRRARKWGNDGPQPSFEELILAKTRELIAKGWMKSPAVLAEEQKQHEKLIARINAEEDEERDLMRTALKNLNGRTDLSNLERSGLAKAYEKIFDGSIDTKEEEHASAADQT
jgi:hypothetical protein